MESKDLDDIIRQHAPRLRAFVRGRVSNREDADDSDNPDIRLLRKMVWQELEKALAELPDEQRQAVELTEVEGLTVKEAAERMGVPIGTFLSRKHYAIVFIRKRLRALYEELTNK